MPFIKKSSGSSDEAISKKQNTKRSWPVRNLEARKYIASPLEIFVSTWWIIRSSFQQNHPKARYFKQSREGPGDESCVAIFDSVSTWRTWTLIIRCFSVHELSWRKQGLYNMRLWLLSNIGFFSLLDCSYCHFVGARGLMASKWRGILQSSQVSLVIFCSYNNRNAMGLWSYLKWVAVGTCTQMLIVDHSGSTEFF